MRDDDEEQGDRTDKAFLRGIRDIVTYMIFLTLFTIVIATGSTGQAYPYNSKLKLAVLGEGDGSFEEILTTDSIYSYLRGQFIDTMYPSDSTTSFDRSGYVLQVNKVIGAIRIEQSRVRIQDSCAVPFVYENTIDQCYPALDKGDRDSCPFGGTCVAARLPAVCTLGSHTI